MPNAAKPPAAHAPPASHATNLPVAAPPKAAALPNVPFADVMAQLCSNAAPMPAKAIPLASMPTLQAPGDRGIAVADTKRHVHEDGDVDPMARQTAQLAPPPAPASGTGTSPTAEQATEPRARASLEELIPQLVKRIAWSGDARRGVVRMELGSGDLAGSTLLVSADNGRVSVQVHAPPGTDTAAWQRRLTARLSDRGLAVESVEVT
jgi:hypothetical protein